MSSHSPSSAGKPTVAVGTLVWRAGVAWRLTIVVEATFGFVHGGFARLVAPRPFGPESLAPQLPGAGIVLTGHACAPSGRPATSVVVRLGIVRDRPVLDKTIHVLGDRASVDAEPRPFERLPLTWDRALGGPGHPLNQAGSGCPNLIDPSDPLRPAGFGAVRREAPERLRWLGRVPLAHVSPLDVPAGVDLRFFHAAPRDQQLDALRGDEWVILDGMHPALPRIWTKLPGPQPSARWLPAGAAPFPVALALNTLTIDADHLLATLTWRGTLALDDPNARGRADASLALTATGGALAAGASAPPNPVTSTAPLESARVMGPAAQTVAPNVGRQTLALEPAGVQQLVAPFPIAPASPPRTEPPSAPRTLVDRPSTIDETDLATRLPRGRAIQPSLAPFPVASPRTAAEPQRLPLPGAPWSAHHEAPPSQEIDHVQKTWTEDLGVGVLRPVAPFSLAEPSHAPAGKAAPLPGAPWGHEPAAKIPGGEEPGSTTITLGDGDPTRSAAIFGLADGAGTQETRPEKLPTPPPPPLVTAPPQEAEPPRRASIGMTLGAGSLGSTSGSVPKPALNLLPPVVMKEPPPPEVEAPRPLRVLGVVLGERPSVAVEPAHVPTKALVEPPPEPAVQVDTPKPAPRVAVTVRDKVIAALAAGELVRGMDLTKADLHGIDFTKAALGGCRLAGADLSGCILRDARLDDADLAGARLSNADLAGADLSRADLSRAHGDGAKLDGAKASRARFVGGTWDGASFARFEATAADFTGASLARARFEDATLLEANLEGAHGDEVTFDRARLPGARFESASFPRGSFAAIDAPDSRWDRATLEAARFDGATLSRANFERATCPRASFRTARLDKATLTHMIAEEAILDGANLEGSDMRASRLSGASLEKAKLGGVVAPRVDLGRAKLEGADLKGANFRTAKLPDANLRGACLDAADLRDADLTRSDLTGTSRAGTKMQGAKLKDAKGATDG